jgi:uncharacterized membrane protein
MSKVTEEARIAERVAQLERRFEQLVGPLRPRADEGQFTSAAKRSTAAAASVAAARPGPTAERPASDVRACSRSGHALAGSRLAEDSSAAARPAISLVDLIGGRLLAWLGGIATLIGIVLFLALAISRGWIGEEARVVLAGVASAGLLITGAWLHARRGRTEAARAMVGAATAGAFSTLVVASQVYHLIPSLLALLLAVFAGALATRLAIHWAGRAVATIGLVGGLLSPVLVGAPENATTISVLAVAFACAIAVVVRQQWGWLGLVSMLVCAPQWAVWAFDGQPAGADVAALAVFGALGLAGAVGATARARNERAPYEATSLALLNAALLAVVGRVALDDASGQLAGEVWLAALALAHAVIGTVGARRLHISAPPRNLLLAIAVVLADVAFASAATGLTLAIGWGAAAMGFAWLMRKTHEHGGEETLLGAALGAHVALTLLRVLADAPVGALGTADAAFASTLSVAMLATTCLASAQFVGDGRHTWRLALNTLGLAAIAYLSATALTGSALVFAWAAEAFALSRVARVAGERLPRYGALGFLGLCGVHVLAVDAPPSGLVSGVEDLASAALALGAIALATFGAARVVAADGRLSRGLYGASAGARLYLASVSIISAFQPGAEAGGETILDLTVSQEGQVLLSALWSIVGLGVLVYGLRRGHETVYRVALGWLLVTVIKVFLYDLSTLTSIYRVISFVVLGLLLLASAYAYQRLRPPPPPDMRSVHPSQR